MNDVLDVKHAYKRLIVVHKRYFHLSVILYRRRYFHIYIDGATFRFVFMALFSDLYGWRSFYSFYI